MVLEPQCRYIDSLHGSRIDSYVAPATPDNVAPASRTEMMFNRMVSKRVSGDLFERAGYEAEARLRRI